MSVPPKFQLNISYGSRVIEFFLLVSAKLHIGSSSSRESTSSRGDNYNAYHKLAVALAEVWGSAIQLMNPKIQKFWQIMKILKQKIQKKLVTTPRKKL